jgi:hypothetical protein
MHKPGSFVQNFGCKCRRCFNRESCSHNRSLLSFYPHCYFTQVFSLKTVVILNGHDLGMAKYTEQCVLTCQHISSSEEGLPAVHKFFQRYLEAMWPLKNCILKLFNRCKEVDSVHDKNKLCPKHAFTEWRFDIWVRMEMSVKKSLCWLGQECGILKSLVLRGLKALRFYP